MSPFFPPLRAIKATQWVIPLQPSRLFAKPSLLLVQPNDTFTAIQERLEEAGLEARVRKKNRLTITLRQDDISAHHTLLAETIQQVLREIQDK